MAEMKDQQGALEEMADELFDIGYQTGRADALMEVVNVLIANMGAEIAMKLIEDMKAQEREQHPLVVKGDGLGMEPVSIWEKPDAEPQFLGVYKVTEASVLAALKMHRLVLPEGEDAQREALANHHSFSMVPGVLCPVCSIRHGEEGPA